MSQQSKVLEANLNIIDDAITLKDMFAVGQIQYVTIHVLGVAVHEINRYRFFTGRL